MDIFFLLLDWSLKAVLAFFLITGIAVGISLCIWVWAIIINVLREFKEGR